MKNHILKNIIKDISKNITNNVANTGTGIKKGVRLRSMGVAAVVLCSATTVAVVQAASLDSGRHSLAAMQALTGQVQITSDSSKHSMLAMQALAGQVLQPQEQEEIATWQTSGEMGSIEESSGITKAQGGALAQNTGISRIADQSGLKGGEDGRDSDDEYADLAIARVTDYVNVRSTPSTDGEILGKIYNGAVAQVLETAGDQDEWFYVTSGSVKGYIKSEYFIYGDAAAEVVDDYVTRYAVVQADRLNVRESADTAAKRIGYLDRGEKALLLSDDGDWIQVSYGGDKKGYIASEFVTIMEEFVYAKSIEEEKAEQEALRAQQKRRETSEEKAPENTTVTVSNTGHGDAAVTASDAEPGNTVPAAAEPNTAQASNGDLRSQIVDYAMQFLGNKYVSGGSSLSGGTDCSGFTCFIYADFGYSISRTPAGQLSSAGRSIDYSEIQPGDIVCYGSSKCTHVGLYIGNGQIIHEANSRKGVVIYEADYDNILGVKNVID